MESFFKFYGCLFEESKSAVDIRRGRKPFVKRETILNEARNKFETEPCGTQILAQPHLSNNSNLFLYIVDPFRLDYSPCKILRETESAILYKQGFKAMYERLRSGEPLF